MSYFDRLFTKNVPHILENIFLSLDCKTLLNCLEVSMSWQNVLTLDSFQKLGKSRFFEDLQEELRQAAAEGNFGKVEKILSFGMVDINYMGSEIETPLLLAAKNGHIRAVKLLLERGAEPNTGDQVGHAPLHGAASRGHKEVVQILLDRGADTNKKDHMRFTPVHLAVCRVGLRI